MNRIITECHKSIRIPYPGEAEYPQESIKKNIKKYISKFFNRTIRKIFESISEDGRIYRF